MTLTKFDSLVSKTKIPISPYNNKTFHFKTFEVSPERILDYLRNEYVLNRSYNIDKVLRRTKKDLHHYLKQRFEYVILDIDKIESKYALDKIIEFFKEKDYFVGLIPSRSYNNKDNYNLKGFVLANGVNNKASIKAVLSEINSGIYLYGKIDVNAVNEGTFQAPTNSEGIVLYNEGKNVPTYELDETIKKSDIRLPYHSKVLEVCLNEYRLRGFNLVKTEGDLLIFSHPSEKTPRGYYIFTNNPMYMNHFNSEKGFNIFDAVKNNKYIKEYFELIEGQKREEEFSNTGKANKVLNINERYLNVKTSQDIIDQWFKTKGLLKIKSPMGTGKSNLIEYIIQNTNRVLIITNRISVAKDFKLKYNLKIYNEDKYIIGDSLIVQYDSLWKYSLKHFDVIILDEYMSLLMHTRNKMNEYGNLNKTKLAYAMNSKMCVIADAFLFGYEDKLIKNKNVYLINNEYRENVNVINYDSISSILKDALNIDNKISISCTSKSTAEAINRLFEMNDYNTMLLTSETLDVEKDSIYKVFDEEVHDYWDVLIYTPTLTVGVSNLNICNHHFHIDESNSVDVISSLQMIRRTRKAENIHIYISEKKRYNQTNIEKINNEVLQNINKYYKRNNTLLITTDEYGDFELSKTGKFVNYIDVLFNKLENNHKDSFILLLKHQIKNKIKNKIIQSDIDINKIKKQIKVEKQELLNKTLNELEPYEYSKDIIEDYKQRNYIVSPKDKMLKIISSLDDLFKNIDMKELKEIATYEVNSKFKFIKELKTLKIFMLKDVNNLKNLISYIISEDLNNKKQIDIFNYMISIKKHNIKLKDKYNLQEIQQINNIIGYNDFKTFIKRIGYKRRNNIYYLDKIYIKYYKHLK